MNNFSVDQDNGEPIRASTGILVTRIRHGVVPPFEMIRDMAVPLYVTEVGGDTNGGGERDEVLLLRPRSAAQLFTGHVIAAMRTGSIDLFERELAKHMREATGGRANVHVLDLSKLGLN